MLILKHYKVCLKFIQTNLAICTLLVLFAFSTYRLNEYVWKLSDYNQGPVVLLIICYLFYTKSKGMFIVESNNSTSIDIGLYILLIVGGSLFLLGRSQFVNFIEVSSFIILIPTVISLVYGISTVKRFWFAIFFLAFLIPLPSFIVAGITMPIKVAVSSVTVDILSLFDYPVARSGVVMQIGQYQLLVADACAGMNTLFTLEGMGLFYLTLVKHDSFARNVLISLLIFPISFFANVIRVIAITLVTYYFGDEVGQGFLHGFAGMTLFVVALLTVVLLDSFIQTIISKNEKTISN